MNYKKNYSEYIAAVKSSGRILDGYKETHHILPRCLGGDDSSDNLVELTAREHFLAHYLLAKIYPGNIKIIMAFLAMCRVNSWQKRYVNSRLYEALKIKRKKLVSKKIVCLNSGKVYDSILDCSKELKMDRKSIYSQLRENGCVSCKGYFFEIYNAGKSYSKEYCESEIKSRKMKRGSNIVKCLETGDIYAFSRKLAIELGLPPRELLKKLSEGSFCFGGKTYIIVKAAERANMYGKIRCKETGEIFSSIKEASRKLEINPTSISRNILKKKASAGRLHWERI